jgi:hypothetical protein
VKHSQKAEGRGDSGGAIHAKLQSTGGTARHVRADEIVSFRPEFFFGQLPLKSVVLFARAAVLRAHGVQPGYSDGARILAALVRAI